MDVQELAEQYRHRTDQELLRLSVDEEQLTVEARFALQSELSVRRLSIGEIQQYRTDGKRRRIKEQRREALKEFKARGRRWFGKADVDYDPETELERFTTTLFVHWFGFPLIPIGTFRVRKKRSPRSFPIPIKPLPLGWIQIVKVWMTAIAIVVFVTFAGTIALDFLGK